MQLFLISFKTSLAFFKHVRNFVYLVLEHLKQGLKLALHFHLVLSVAEDLFHASIIIIVHQLADAYRFPRRLNLLLDRLWLQLLLC